MAKLSEEELRLARELEAEEAALLKDAETPESETVQARTARAERDEPDPEPELRRDSKPAFEVNVPHDASERLAKLSQTKADVIRLFEDGEINAREYADAIEAIDDRREDIRSRQRFASAAKEAHESALDSAWRREVDRFMAGPGKNIEARGDGAKIAFDEYVKKVTGDAANSRLSDRAQLAKAHKAFLADFGGFNQPAGKEASPSRETGGTDFAAIDRLEGLAYERAIAKMTPAERAAYGID